jgi:hypothetical protein
LPTIKNAMQIIEFSVFHPEEVDNPFMVFFYGAFSMFTGEFVQIILMLELIN